MQHHEYVSHDATGLAELVRNGEVSADEVLAAANARLDAVNATINAVVHRIDPPVPAAEDGPFTGVPFLLKDMDGWLVGHPASHGSRSLREWVPDVESELVGRYRAAGLRVVGKTNCPEFGILGVTEPELHGPTRNPWDVNRVPGGSSGGSAAAIAAGIVPLASAGDGGGSIRIPASDCGLFGLKPSRGLTPLAPENDPWLGLVSRHVLTRSVRDSAAVLDASTAPFPGALYAQPARPRSYLRRLHRAPRRLTVGVSRRSFLNESLHPDCLAAVDDTAGLLASLGHRVVDLELPIAHETVARAYLTIVASAVAADVRATERKTGRSPTPSLFERSTWLLKQAGEAISARDLYEAHQVAAETAQRLGEMFEDVDVHLSATTAAPPPLVHELGLSTAEKAALSVLQRLPVSRTVLGALLRQLAHDSLQRTPNTQVYNLAGVPAMSVPLCWNEAGLPIGTQLAAPLGADELLLRLAQQLHDARPWFDRLPPLSP